MKYGTGRTTCATQDADTVVSRDATGNVVVGIYTQLNARWLNMTADEAIALGMKIIEAAGRPARQVA